MKEEKNSLGVDIEYFQRTGKCSERYSSGRGLSGIDVCPICGKHYIERETSSGGTSTGGYDWKHKILAHP